MCADGGDNGYSSDGFESGSVDTTDSPDAGKDLNEINDSDAGKDLMEEDDSDAGKNLMEEDDSDAEKDLMEEDDSDAGKDLMEEDNSDAGKDLMEEDDSDAEKDLMKENDSDSGEDLTKDESENDTEEKEPVQNNEEETTADLDVEKQTDEEKLRAEINEKSEYSSEVNDYIKSVEELEIYQKAGLKEEVVDGRVCLIRPNFDPDYFDEETGMTNRMLIESKNRSPKDPETGELIQLHHVGQNYDAPLVELTFSEHKGKGNYAILHTSKEESWRNDPYKANHYNNTQKPNHWKARL